MTLINDHGEFGKLKGAFRIAAYERTSSDGQEKAGTIKSQHDDIINYLKKHYPEAILNTEYIYTDDGWTSTNIERPGLDRLRMDMTENKWDAVIFYDPDRIARESFLQLIIVDELKSHEKEILFCTTHSPELGDEDGRMMFELRSMMSKYEKVRAQARFRIGKLRKARDEKILLSVAPYGYRLVNKATDPVSGLFTDTHLIIDEVEAAVVRKIFNWLAIEQCTLRQIVKKLYDLGIKPRKNKKGIWNTSTLGSLVRNQTYIGVAYYRTSEAIEPLRRLKPITGHIKRKKTSRKLRPESEWIKIEGVPAILDTESERNMFELAQEQLKTNFKRNERNRTNEYLLTGKTYCACGSARTGEGPQKGKYLYYRCGSRVRSYPLNKSCEHQAINARIADKIVWDELLKTISSKELLEAQLKAVLSKIENTTDSSAIDCLHFDLELKKIQCKLEKLETSYLEEIFTAQQYKDHSKKLNDEKNAIEAKIIALKKKSEPKIDSSQVRPDEIDSIVATSQSVLSDLSFDQKRGIVLRLIDKVVGIPGELTVTGHIGITSNSNSGAIDLKYSANYSSKSKQNHVKFKTVGRNCGVAECGEVDAVYCPD